MKQILKPFLCLSFGLIFVFGKDFESASTIDQTREQISKLPKDDIWWTVYGEDMGWNFKNLHRMFPTANIYREGQVRLLDYNLSDAISEYKVDTPDGEISFKNFLYSNHSTTMGIVILHKGKIVFEEYPRMEPYEKPIYWSVTKVFVSTVLAILEDRGLVDVSRPIDYYLPALGESDYAGVTIRNILDMASGVDCPDEYEDRDACYYQFAASIGDAYWDDDSPDNPYTFLANLKTGTAKPQGESFDYSGANTFVIGWLIEEITGMPFQDVLTKEIWRNIGAEGDASMLAPRYGVPVTDGGLLARLRDVARFGLLFTPSYSVASSKKIISDRYLNLILDGGNPELLVNARSGRWRSDDIKHNVYQWDSVFRNNDMYKGGWGGQGLLVNPERDIVAVYTGYFKKDQSEVRLLRLLRTVLEELYGMAE
jgi:CubicO group peptidase (beta-lactamase class C family)